MVVLVVAVVLSVGVAMIVAVGVLMLSRRQQDPKPLLFRWSN